MSSFRQSRTARAPTRAQRTTAFSLENDAASRETSRDDLAVDARTAHFADIATLVVHIADVDLRAPVRQSPRVTFNRANRAGLLRIDGSGPAFLKYVSVSNASLSDTWLPHPVRKTQSTIRATRRTACAESKPAPLTSGRQPVRVRRQDGQPVVTVTSIGPM